MSVVDVDNTPPKISNRLIPPVPPFYSEVLETLGFLSTTDVQSHIAQRRRIPTRTIRWRFLVCLRTDRGKADARHETLGIAPLPFDEGEGGKKKKIDLTVKMGQLRYSSRLVLIFELGRRPII
jgi:hypothetical protein